MDRRRFLVTSVAGTLAAPLAAQAQQAGVKVPRVGVLFGSPASNWIEALRQGLRDVGFVEGRTILTEWRSAEGRYERLPGFATELVRLGVDVLIAHPTVAVQAARRATASNPIVMPASADPVGAGLVESLARPGGNITGSTFISSEITGKRLELLKEMLPHATSVAAVANPDNPATALQLTQARTAGATLGLRLRLIEVNAETQLEAAFAVLLRDRADALLVIDDPMLGSRRVDIVKRVATARLPAMYGWKDWVDAGGLLSFGANVDEMFRQAGRYVDKILKGAKPADLPIEQPTKFEFAINLKTAKALGLTIPPSLLARADQIIE
jgi:putative tryptophan/tyrosine transport system substrate-binding protein